MSGPVAKRLNLFLARIEAGLPENSFDRVYSISVIEHIPPEEISSLMQEIRRILRPGGMAVMTIDLFLDLHPFTEERRNQWGTNVDVGSLVEASGLSLTKGDPDELLGFRSFDPQRVRGALGEYLIGAYPVCSQALVLSK